MKICRLGVYGKTLVGSEFYSLETYGTKVRANQDVLDARRSIVNLWDATVCWVSLAGLTNRVITEESSEEQNENGDNIYLKICDDVMVIYQTNRPFPNWVK